MKYLAIAVVVVLGLFLGGWWYIDGQISEWLTSPKPGNEVRKIVEIKNGTSVRGVLQVLIRENLSSSTSMLKYIGRLGPKLPSIQAGEYELSSKQSPLEILEMMAAGKVKTYSVTIPEGLVVGEIIERLKSNGLAGADEIDKLKNDKNWLAKFHIPQLEGFLLPETYTYSKSADVKDVVEMMISQFNRVVTNGLKKEIEKSGYELFEIVTIASIIEKEAGSPAEYKLISSVIKNRLAKHMPLQMDPTVIYGIKNFDGNLTRAHLRKDHPWNTYTRPGLPISPICNPGIGAIEAALRPADTTYLYFVSMNNGTHKFTSTLREHNAAVNKYQVRGVVGPK